MKNRKAMIWGLSKTTVAFGAALVFIMLLSYHSEIGRVIAFDSAAHEAHLILALMDCALSTDYSQIGYESPDRLSNKAYRVDICEDGVRIEFEDGLVYIRNRSIPLGGDFSYEGGDYVRIEAVSGSLEVY